jgi:hypothetical protein
MKFDGTILLTHLFEKMTAEKNEHVCGSLFSQFGSYLVLSIRAYLRTKNSLRVLCTETGFSYHSVVLSSTES